jgi:hypothetical protein
LFYLGRVYGSTPKLPLWFKHFDSGPDGAGEAYHLGIFGKTGSGKSVLAKMILLAYARYPQMALLALDPQGEFAKDLRGEPTGEFRLPMRKVLEHLRKPARILGVRDLVLDRWELFAQILYESPFFEQLSIPKGENRELACRTLVDRLDRQGMRLTDLAKRETFNKAWALLGDEQIQKVFYRSPESRGRFQSVYQSANSEEFYRRYWKPVAWLFQEDRKNAQKVDSLLYHLLKPDEKTRPLVVIDLSQEQARGIGEDFSDLPLLRTQGLEEREPVLFWTETVQALVVKRLLEGIRQAAEAAYRESRSLNALVLIDEAHRLAPREEPENPEKKAIRDLLISPEDSMDASFPFIPEDLKRQLLDGLVGFLADQAQRRLAGEKASEHIRRLSSEAAFLRAFDQALERGLRRFRDEYTQEDEDLVPLLVGDPALWRSPTVRKALRELVSRPGAHLPEARRQLLASFSDVLPQRVNRERVDRAVSYLLGCIAEELWSLPAAKEVREAYSLQFQRITAEEARQQTALIQAQLQALTDLREEVRAALAQLTEGLARQALAAASIPALPVRPRPYHNLPQPDYARFVGREKEREWLRQRLSPQDRAWVVILSGIGGVGKTALALATAHEYLRRYDELPPEERFDAIVWASAKEEVLTAAGRERAAPAGLVARTLADIYAAIAQVLEREAITRAATREEQDRLVQQALTAQRTLLVLDNLDTLEGPGRRKCAPSCATCRARRKPSSPPASAWTWPMC